MSFRRQETERRPQGVAIICVYPTYRCPLPNPRTTPGRCVETRTRPVCCGATGAGQLHLRTYEQPCRVNRRSLRLHRLRSACASQPHPCACLPQRDFRMSRARRIGSTKQGVRRGAQRRRQEMLASAARPKHRKTVCAGATVEAGRNARKSTHSWSPMSWSTEAWSKCVAGPPSSMSRLQRKQRQLDRVPDTLADAAVFGR